MIIYEPVHIEEIEHWHKLQCNQNNLSTINEYINQLLINFVDSSAIVE